MTLSEQLFQIAAIDPDSPIGIALKLVAEKVSKDETRKAGGRSRTAKWREKHPPKCHSDSHGDVTVTHHGDVTVTVTEKCIDTNTYTFIDNNITALTELDRLHSAKTKKTARGTRLPESWRASFEDREYARAAGFSEEQIDRMEEDYRDYWIAQPGSKGLKNNWPATWRRWVRTAAERLPRHSNVSLFPAKPKPLTQKEANRAAALAGLDAIINGTLQLNIDPNADGGGLLRPVSRVLPASQPNYGVSGGSDGYVHDLPGKSSQGGL